MIYSVRGTLIASGVNFAVVECGGVGYKMSVSLNTATRLPQQNKEAMLYTYLYVREDAEELFGFYSQEELESFKLLIGISGVGPKAALSILSDMSPQKMAAAIAAGDAKAFTKASGVGMKLASRIALELKDKITTEDIVGTREEGGEVRADAGNIGEAVAALIALGYTASEATAAAAKYPADASVNDIIKGCLKDMSSFR